MITSSLYGYNRFSKRISLLSAMLGILFFFFPEVIYALPQGGSVVSGNITIPQNESGSATETITQKTQKGIINWNSFSVGEGEHVYFQQPGKASITLNRVTGDNVSNIFGAISATGRIILINRAGIIFGPNSRVDASGLIATTADMTNAHFLNGQYTFVEPQSYAGGNVPKIINSGTISIRNEGLAALVAPRVENYGIIEADLGKVVIGSFPPTSQYTLDLYGDQLINFSIDPVIAKQALSNTTGDVGIVNSGTIIAHGGKVLITANAARDVADSVINMSGVIEANSVAEKKGEIILMGGNEGVVHISGKIKARGEKSGEKGGKVTVVGQHVGLFDQGQIDVSGMNGGGEVLFGGGPRGAQALPIYNALNASAVFVSGNAQILANALEDGQGGRISIWGTDAAYVYGTLQAKGGQFSGDGGLIETSGHYLDVDNISVDTSAVNGIYGVWLLDPYNVTISLAASSGGTFNCGGGTCTWVPSATGSNIQNAQLNNFLILNNVIIDTSGAGLELGRITVNAPISWTNSPNPLTSLTFKPATQSYSAGGGILINQNITGSGNLIFVGDVALNGTIALQAKSINFGGNIDTATTPADLTVTANSGGVSFNQIGSSNPLNSLNMTSFAGFTLLSPNDTTVTTVGSQTYTINGGGVWSASTPNKSIFLSTTGVGGTVSITAPFGFDSALTDNLTVNSNAIFSGIIGNQTVGGLKTLTVNGITTLGTSAPGQVYTTGFQTYNGPVNIYGSGNNLLKGSTVTFNSTLDSQTPTTGALQITGNAEFNQNVGATYPLTSLSVSGSSTIAPTSITTSGLQSYTGTATFTNVSPGTTLTSNSGGAINFLSRVEGPGALDISTSGGAKFGSTVGATTRLENLTVNAGAGLTLNGLSISTIDFQTYFNNITLSSGTTNFSGSNIFLLGGLNDPTSNLIITGNAFIDNDLTLQSLNVLNNTEVSNTSPVNITTSGLQNYGGIFTLDTPTLNISASDTHFNDTVIMADSTPRTLNINSGNVAFNDQVGTISIPLGALNVLNGYTTTITAPVYATAQHYSGSVKLAGSGIILSGNTGVFDSSVIGNGFDLTLQFLTQTTNINSSIFNGIRNFAILTPANITGSMTTSGTQTYSNTVNLVTGATLTGTTITFEPGSTLDGANGLTITGNAVFQGPVGTTTPLTSLSVTGTSDISDNVSIKTTLTGPQHYTGAVTLEAGSSGVNLSGSTITFVNTVNGANSLAITGNAVFDSIVGGLTHLTGLSVTGMTTLGSGASAITTDLFIGSQTYTGLVTLGAPLTTFTGLSGTFTAGVTGGGHSLTLNFPSTTTDISNAFSNILNFESLGPVSFSGSGSVTTTGTQKYDSPVTLNASTNLTGSTVTFGSGSTVNGGNALTITGNVAFNSNVGAITALTGLSISGASSISDAVSITTTGTQQYSGPVDIQSGGGGINLTGSTMTFGDTVNGTNALSISGSPGNAVFNGSLGLVRPLASLTVNGSTTLGSAATDVKTIGTQTYTGTLTLGAPTTTLRGDTGIFTAGVTGGGHSLILNFSSDADISSVFSNILNFESVGPLSFSGSGSVTTTGTQMYDSAVTLNVNTHLTGTTITFGSGGTVNGANTLAITGNAVFDAIVGGSIPLTGLSVTGTTTLGSGATAITTDLSTGTQTYTGHLTLGAPTTTFMGQSGTFSGGIVGGGLSLILHFSSMATTGGTFNNLLNFESIGPITFAGSGNINASGTQTYDSEVILNVDTHLAAATVIFNSGSSVDGNNALTITGNAVFSGQVGGTTPLTSLSVSGTSTINNGVSIATSGTQQYTGAVTLGTGSSGINLTGSTMTFGSTVNGGNALSISGVPGNAVFNGSVGNATRLTSLNVQGTTTLGSAATDVKTTGSQIYTGALTLGAPTTTFTGQSGTFTGNVVGGGKSLILTFIDPAEVNSTIFNNILNFESKGPVNFSTTGNMTTSGTQAYDSSVDLFVPTHLTGTTITFNSVSAVNGANALTITGNAVFSGQVGNNTSLASLSVTGASTFNDGAMIKTAGTQQYSGMATLGSGTSGVGLTGSTITFGSTVNGGNSLDIFGDTQFSGIVGGLANLLDLTVHGSTTLGSAVTGITTTGAQVYLGSLILEAPTTKLKGSSGTFSGGVVGNGLDLVLDFISSVDVNDTIFNNINNFETIGPAVITGSGSMTTSGSQTYDSGVTLATNAAFTGTSGDFGSGLIGNNFDLTLSFSTLTDINGFFSNIHNFTITGPALLNVDLTTSGSQSYLGTVNLGGNTVLTAPNTATFGGLLFGHGYDLTLNFGTQTILNGGFLNIGNLLISGPALFTAGVLTTGNQTYEGASILGDNINLVSLGGAVIFDNTLNSDTAVTPRALNIGGNAVINSLLGNINPLASLSVTGTTTFGGTNPEVITQGAQTYQGPVRLASDAALSSTGNGDIEFQQTINSTSAPKSLTVNTGGITKFEGNVGTINPLMNITTDAAGTTDLNAPIMHTVGVQTYNDSTVLTVPTEIISGGVAFNSTLLAPFALTINADSGDISFGGSSGATSTLTDLTITNARNVTNNGLLLANSFTQLGGSGTTNFGTNIGSSTIIGGGAGTLYVVTNNAIGNIDVGKLLLGTNFANLTGLVGGSPGITTNIVPLNFILPKTHFFNGIDLFNAIIVPVAVDIAFHSMPYYLIESRALRPLTDQAGICIIWPELGIKDCGGVKWSKEQNK